MGTITIAGGTGFIGKHLCVQMSDRGIDGVTFSKTPDLAFLKDYAPTISAYTLEDLAGLAQQFAASDVLVYLASDSTPATDSESLRTEFENNVLPAARTFEMALRANPSVHIIYLSSGGTVYGECHSSPISESSPVRPSSLYSNGKIAIENYLEYLSKMWPDSSHTILRPSNPVGKWSRSRLQGFINVVLANSLEGLPVTLYGNGDVVRDYLCADDLVQAILMTIGNRQKSHNQVWNVGTGVGYSLNEILTKIEALINLDIRVKRAPQRKIEIPYNVLDCSRISDAIAWRAAAGIDEIILRTWSELTQARR